MYKPKITLPTIWRQTLQFSSKHWRAAGQRLLHWLLPNTCYSCKRDLPCGQSGPLCTECQEQVKEVGPLYCQRCGKPLPDGGAHCYQCRGSKAREFKCKIIRSAVVFGPQVRAVIHAWKYSGQTHWTAYLTALMRGSWPKYEELAQAQVLIPVPLHSKKFKKRGYNQSALLARELGRLQGLPVEEQALIRSRNTPSQTQFGRAGRLQNMSGAFACVNPASVKGKIILLIDDVATTGATFEGCAQALKEAGAKKVMAYTLAREV